MSFEVEVEVGLEDVVDAEVEREVTEFDLWAEKS